jgi:hypothetical protein
MTDETLSAPASSQTPSDEGAPVSISPKSDGEIESNPIEEAKKVLEETRKVLEETKKERARIEKATAEALINGRSYAGQEQPKAETEDEKWAREAKIRYAGTGMCPA